MKLFKWWKTKEVEDNRIASVVRASAEGIATVQSAGRYPLSFLVVGAAVVVVSLIVLEFVVAVGELFPWVITFAAFVTLLGVVLYILDHRSRQNMVQQSLDRYHELVREAFRKYLDSFEKIDGFQFQGILSELDKIYRTSVEKVVSDQKEEQA